LKGFFAIAGEAIDAAVRMAIVANMVTRRSAGSLKYLFKTAPFADFLDMTHQHMFVPRANQHIMTSVGFEEEMTS
jgi:hypothetical protein